MTPPSGRAGLAVRDVPERSVDFCDGAHPGATCLAVQIDEGLPERRVEIAQAGQSTHPGCTSGDRRGAATLRVAI